MFNGFRLEVAQPSKLFACLSTAPDIILNRDDAIEHAQNATSDQNRFVLQYVERNLPRLLLIAHRNTTDAQVSRNAAALIIHYMKTHADTSEIIRNIVPSTLGVLSRKGTISAPLAIFMQRILLAAFDEDFSETSYAINISLGDEVVHGAIRNLASSTIVGETLIALFGSALSADVMMQPSTIPNIFTDVWIKHGFPHHFVAYCKVAMTTLDGQPFFYFAQELLKRGLSHSSGPIVEKTLLEPSISLLIDTVVDCCVESQCGKDHYPLAQDALSLITSILALTRKTMLPTDTVELYKSKMVLYNAPSQAVSRVTKKLAAIAKQSTIGIVIAISDILLELLQFRIEHFDSLVLESGLLEAILRAALLRPHNNFLANNLERTLTHIFSRTTLTSGSFLTGCDSTTSTSQTTDILVEFFCKNEVGFALLSEIKNTAVEPSLLHTALQSHVIQMCVTLNELPLFSGERPDFKSALLFRELLELQLAPRLYNWQSPITGNQFAAKGSGCPGFLPFHRPLLNPQNVSVDEVPHEPADIADEEIIHIAVPVATPSSSRDRRYAVEEGVEENAETDSSFSASGLLHDDEDDEDGGRPLRVANGDEESGGAGDVFVRDSAVVVSSMELGDTEDDDVNMDDDSAWTEVVIQDRNE